MITMDLEKRVTLMVRLGEYFKAMDEELVEIVELAHRNNAWFTPEFVNFSLASIAEFYLDETKLRTWIANYPKIAEAVGDPKLLGIVMAGNIPLVGFHDFLCGFISGNKLLLKLSIKDTTLWQHIFKKLSAWESSVPEFVQESVMLKGCDAYIATGSNNSARYFEYYFEKYPHIIRKNRSSVAILDGKETAEELDLLSEDINLYFGLGCRNVTQMYVPKDYNFEALLGAMNRYINHIDHNKFKNNYDFQLAIYLLNSQFYMSNGHLLLIEDNAIYAPISVVNYQYYEDSKPLLTELNNDDRVQCISSHITESSIPKLVALGCNQRPSLMDYADGVDTMKFLLEL